MATVSKELKEFVFARIVEENGTWTDKPGGNADGPGLTAYLDWLFSRPASISPDTYYRQTAARWKHHRGYQLEWIPRQHADGHAGRVCHLVGHIAEDGDWA